jgi:hypothetical protein
MKDIPGINKQGGTRFPNGFDHRNGPCESPNSHPKYWDPSKVVQDEVILAMGVVLLNNGQMFCSHEWESRLL